MAPPSPPSHAARRLRRLLTRSPDSDKADGLSPLNREPSPPKSSDFHTNGSQPQQPHTTPSGLSAPAASGSPTLAANSLLSSSPAATSQSLAALSLSPSRTFPPEVGVHDTIIEEDDETDTDNPNEPVTPTSDRQSREAYHANTNPKPETTETTATDRKSVV